MCKYVLTNPPPYTTTFYYVHLVGVRLHDLISKSVNRHCGPEQPPCSSFRTPDEVCSYNNNERDVMESALAAT